ncbi:MAG: glycosyltransferase family 4 protein [Phycisphaerae bacterium]|nr:glycosyltransferase family 4 protein [Phycisphaerae bacterium]
MTAVLHVIDASCDETGLQVLRVLRARWPGDGCRHAVCSIDGLAAERTAYHWGEDILRAQRRLRMLNWAPQLPAIASRTKARLLHAWGIEAAAACSTLLPDLPLILTLLNPGATRNAARWLRSFPTDATVVAGNQATRRRLIGAGMAPERVVVVRGPVDFGAINLARRQNIRQSVVGEAKPVILLQGPASQEGGQYYGIWAGAVLKQVHGDLRVVMPYDSHEGRRLERFARSTRIRNLLTVPDARLTWPQLVTCADVFVVPAVDDVCTEPIAMAMAAGLVVVGSAVRSVAELIANERSGLLCKAGEPRAMAGLILKAIEDDDLRRRLAETARARVYEACGMRAFVDDYARLYENVLSGRMPGDGVRDTAAVA